MSDVLNISALNVSSSGAGELGGICGFASTLGALYENGMLTKSGSDSVGKGDLNTRVLASIVTYLRLLKSENNTQYLGEITSFTQCFPGYEAFSIDKYIKKIESVADDPTNIKEDFSIAMPPNPVADFVRRNGMKAVLVRGAKPELKANVILGLGDKTKLDKWDGLKHWVYRNKTTVYNYGEEYGSGDLLTKMKKLFPGTDWEIVYQLALG